MNNNQLQEWCEYWQELLGLSDWKIKAQFVHSHDMQKESDGSAHDGEISVNWAKREADINVLDEDCYPSGATFEQDVHYILVHELIHCYFDPFYPKKEGLMMEVQEQAIDGLALAFVELHRMGE